MSWAIGGSFALGSVLCGVAASFDNRSNPDDRWPAPLYWLAGIALLVASVVLAIGNAAVQALL